MDGVKDGDQSLVVKYLDGLAGNVSRNMEIGMMKYQRMSGQRKKGMQLNGNPTYQNHTLKLT